MTVTDASEAAITPYQMQLFQHFQVQASLSLPIFLADRLWGLLVVQTCVSPRQWTNTEIARLYQVGTELTLKLQSHELQQQGQHVFADGRQALAIQLRFFSGGLNQIFC